MPSKVKIAKKQIGDKSIVNMFNQMLGTGDIDPAIVRPKYDKIKTKVRSTAKLLQTSTQDVFSKFGQDGGCDEINKYVKNLNSIEFKEEFKEKNELGECYTKLKENHYVKLMIITCKALIPYKNQLSTDGDFDDSFIARIPGFDFCPFPFSSFNIKSMWMSKKIDDRIKKYTFTVLRIILNNCKDVYETITSPDVDVKEFSKVIIKSISEVKKSIPRCDKAFAKIEESVSLLENNFNGYYKDFIQSQNPSTIIESFVIDVSNNGNADVQTTRQFRKIIDYYRKATHGKIKDPKIKKVFDMLNSNFNMMEAEVIGNNKPNNQTPDAKDAVENNEDGKKLEESPQLTNNKPLTGKQKRELKRNTQSD